MVRSVDLGLWPATLSDSDRTTLVRKLTIREETIMPKDSKGKPFPEYLKYAKAANGRENVKRDWLVHSESSNALFCIPCILLPHGNKRPSHSALNSVQGYRMCDVQWRHMYDKFPVHENSDKNVM